MDLSFPGNKENVLRPNENIANLSISSLNCTFGFNASKINVNDSYTEGNSDNIVKSESADIQMENYERQIKKISLENISLRKKNKNLTGLARLKEEQLIETLETVKKQKSEIIEKNHNNYNIKLDNYYECFLQIENQSNFYKLKYEHIQEEMEEMKERFENLEIENEIENEFEAQSSPIVEKVEENKEMNEEVMKISMEHVETEITKAKNNAKKEGERRRSEMPARIEKILETTIDYKLENETLKERIEELAVEKNMIETKHASIEAALARWIFRACDNNTEIAKIKETNSDFEKEKEELVKNVEQLRNDRDSSLKLFNMNQVNLDETKSILSEKIIELEKLSIRNKTLEMKNHDFNDQILFLTNKILTDIHTQTENITLTTDIHTQTENITLTTDIHTQTTEPTSIVTKSASSSKLSDINSTGIVANIAKKFNGKVNILPVVSTCVDSIDSAGLHNELKSIKIKNDHLILDKTSLKSKNEELSSEIRDLELKLEVSVRESSEMATFITNLEKSDQIPEKKKVSLPVPPKSLISSGQQTSRSGLEEKKTTMTTQTSNCSVSYSVTNTHKPENLWETRIKAVRDEMNTELCAVKAKNMEEINDLTGKLVKLEADIKDENAKIEKIEYINKEISFKLSNKNEEYLQLEHALQEQSNEFKKKKQIADTIIQQQKKLLDHIQSTGSNKNEFENTNKKQKPAKNTKKNPLLAHLSKPSVPYKFSHQMSVTSQVSTISSTSSTSTDSIKTMSTNSIEAELNSNYETYSELNRIRRPPDMVPPPPQVSSQKQEIVPVKPQINKPEINKNIHVFITGLNTFPVYCHVCQHLIPIIAYASKCQICSFTCHSQCSNLNKHKSNSVHSSVSASMNDDLFKYCQTNYMKTNMAYNNYVNKLIKTSMDTQSSHVHDKTQNHLLSDYLHMYVDGKWKKLWVSLRIDGQLDLYQSRTNNKSFDNINLINERVKFETDYNMIKKLLANYSTQLSSTTTSNNGVNNSKDSNSSNTTSLSYKTEESVNLYEAVDQNQPRTDFTTSLVILLYTPKNCVQLGFDTFSKKIIWLDALQSSCLINASNGIPSGIPSSNSSGNISKKLALAAPVIPAHQKFNSFNLDRALNPFLELSDFLSVNSFCFINERLIALACDDGLYVSEPGAPSINGAPSLSLVKINTIESAHKLNHEFGKLCLIGRRSRQFLAIDIHDMLTAKVIHKNVSDDSSNDNNSDDEEDEKLINVKIEHIHSIDRCHLFESSLNSNGNWYSAVATPETIFILLFNQTSNKFNLIKTINTQNDSPCLCLKFSQTTNHLIYGCTKEFYKMDMTNLQSTPIVENLVSTGKKILNDEDLLVSSKKKQPISVSMIHLKEFSENEAVLLCYEDYALILNYNMNIHNWQLQQAQSLVGNNTKKINSSSSINPTSNKDMNSSSSVACLKWPRGLPPLQIEYDEPNLYLFYNDSIIVYKISLEDGLFMFKRSGIAFIYKPRFLSTLHISNANCIIISNRRTLTNTGTGSTVGTEISEITNNRNIYYDTENDYNDEEMDDIRSSSKITGFDDEDRICLSHFSPYDISN